MAVAPEHEPVQAPLWPDLTPEVAARPAPARAARERTCPVCAQSFLPTGRQRYCSPACRATVARAAATPRRRRPARVAPGATGPVPGPLAAIPPAPRGAPTALPPARRLALAWQLLGAYRATALWQAIPPAEQVQAAAISLALYQWARDLETLARRQRAASAPDPAAE